MQALNARIAGMEVLVQALVAKEAAEASAAEVDDTGKAAADATVAGAWCHMCADVGHRARWAFLVFGNRHMQ